MEKLIANKPFKSTALDTYDYCVEKYNFNPEKRGLFSRQKPLYSINATQEGYAVLMLAHSNFTNTQGGSWENIISNDYATIIEKHKSRPYVREQDKIRVTFAKMPQHDGKYKYVFLGVYIYDKQTETNHYEFPYEVHYKQINKVYPFKNTVAIPAWLKVDEKVEHRMLGQVTITYLDERNNTISIRDENGKEYDLNLENCLEQKIFSPIEKEIITPSSDLPPFVTVGKNIIHKKYGIVEVLSLSDEFIFIQDSNKKVYYVGKETAHELLAPLPAFKAGTTITHKELGKVWVTKVTESTITVIDKNGTPYCLNLDYCTKHNLLSENND